MDKPAEVAGNMKLAPHVEGLLFKITGSGSKGEHFKHQCSVLPVQRGGTFKYNGYIFSKAVHFEKNGPIESGILLKTKSFDRDGALS